jgi:hypothetical protein
LCYVMDERQGAIYQVQCYLWCRMTVSWISVVGKDCILDIFGVERLYPGYLWFEMTVCRISLV